MDGTGEHMLRETSQSEKNNTCSHSFMEYNEQHKLMNRDRSRDREASIRLSNLRGKIDEGMGKEERSTKGLICMHISLTNGHRHQGCEGMVGGRAIRG